jgi:hypothetical protein
LRSGHIGIGVTIGSGLVIEAENTEDAVLREQAAPLTPQ